MQWFSRVSPPEQISLMRAKWEKGEISVREYHNFIEKMKHLVSAERVFRF